MAIVGAGQNATACFPSPRNLLSSNSSQSKRCPALDEVPEHLRQRLIVLRPAVLHKTYSSLYTSPSRKTAKLSFSWFVLAKLISFDHQRSNLDHHLFWTVNSLAPRPSVIH